MECFSKKQDLHGRLLLNMLENSSLPQKVVSVKVPPMTIVCSASFLNSEARSYGKQQYSILSTCALIPLVGCMLI